jgi:hypothetical protein
VKLPRWLRRWTWDKDRAFVGFAIASWVFILLAVVVHFDLEGLANRLGFDSGPAEIMGSAGWMALVLSIVIGLLVGLRRRPG